MTYSAQALAVDFQFELNQFFHRLDRLTESHGSPNEEMLALLGLRGADLEDQYRNWIEEGEE